MIFVNPGELTEKIQIQARSTTKDDNSPALSWHDAHGGAATLWSTVGADIRARVKPTTGSERFDAAATQAQVRYQVVYRYKAFRALTEKHRITFIQDEGASPNITRTLNIEAVIPHGLDWIEVLCSEGDDQG